MKPLEGIKVLDLTQFLSGPYCTMILADMGAEVIKLERPLTGDLTRYSPPGRDGGSTYFVGCNRGKKSVLINLKDPKQREVFLTMVSKADVVVENYKPGTMEKFGCGYDPLKEINPKLIYTAISGFGQTGPLRAKGGLDLVIQAMSGLMSVTGERGGEPLKCGISVGDLVSGIYGALATMIALFHRERTGEGCYADISMLDSVISIMDSGISKYCLTGELPKRIGNRHPNGAPFQPFDTSDGQVFVCCPADEQWQSLALGLGRKDLAEDKRFLTTALRTANEPALEALLIEEIGKWTTKDLTEMLDRNNVVYGQIKNVKEVVEDPQVIARNMIVETEFPGAGVFRTSGSPLKMSIVEEQTRYTAPELGADTEAVLKELGGLEASEIEEMYAPVMGKVKEAVAKKRLK